MVWKQLYTTFTFDFNEKNIKEIEGYNTMIADKPHRIVGYIEAVQNGDLILVNCNNLTDNEKEKIKNLSIKWNVNVNTN